VEFYPFCSCFLQEMIDEFRRGLQLCMQLASDIGVNEHAVCALGIVQMFMLRC